MTPLDLVRERCKLVLDGPMPQPSPYIYRQRAKDIPTLLTIFLHNIAHQAPYVSQDAIYEEVEDCFDCACAHNGGRRWLVDDLITLIRDEPIICRFVLQYDLVTALGHHLVSTQRVNTYRLQTNLELLLRVPAKQQDSLSSVWYQAHLDMFPLTFYADFEPILYNSGAVAAAYNLLKVWWCNDSRLYFLRDILVTLLPTQAVNYFALQVLIDDGYLLVAPSIDRDTACRFFAIMARLPLELKARVAFATTGFAQLGDMSINDGYFPRAMIDKAIKQFAK